VEEHMLDAEKICESLLDDQKIGLNHFNVIITRTTQRNRSISFNFDVSPIDYMDLVIPMALVMIGIGCFFRLEKDLVAAGREIEQLKSLRILWTLKTCLNLT
jgi:hypothetical protein